MQDFAVVVDRGLRFMWCESLGAGVVLGISGKPLRGCFAPAMDDAGQHYCLAPPARAPTPRKGWRELCCLSNEASKGGS